MHGLLAKASNAYDDAQKSLAKGDLGTYQAKVDEMGRAIEQANKLAGGAVNSTIPAPVPAPVSVTVSTTGSATSTTAVA